MSPLQDWIVPEWPAPPRVRSLITTRRGGASRGLYESFNLGLASGDDAVEANRRQLRGHLPADPKWLRQVHGTRVVTAEATSGLEAADASVVHAPHTVCAVLTADCLPVLLCDRSGTVAAVAHAGWRGLSAGIVEHTIERMRVAGQELLAFLGPAIGSLAFEVGDDVRHAFVHHDAQAATAFARHGEHKWHADLFALARQRLAGCGVEAVYGGGLCTYSDPARFYSYRRDGTTGRMAALIWLEA